MKLIKAPLRQEILELEGQPETITFLDDDDVYLPRKIQNQSRTYVRK